MSLGPWLAQLRSTDLRELELSNLGCWPGPIKTLLAVLLLLLTQVAGYSLYLSPHLETLGQLRREEQRFKLQFADKAGKVANLERYREQLGVLQHRFSLVMRQLPSDAEVPGLLEDISQMGQGSGLAFEEIKLQSELVREFYVELPIQIAVTGAYHDLATFVSGIAGLPRVVTLHDFQIKPVDRGNPPQLRMSIEARTYRYDSQEPHS
ncbi:type 4a pilus biogenesis protein PilO [Pseudomonas protegens]|uniref:type 4a pilus biogenesis protein PilO n=1 Tax=Pseudomonas protegens TaxID=380021 RepID=UPI0029371941|nr:type 4a pilus biogenesis protein PilO [Pseudomonas protegens]WOE80086.1 type 4a pilus biogenesis protein PilO [Pseudomonas protegens]